MGRGGARHGTGRAAARGRAGRGARCGVERGAARGGSHSAGPASAARACPRPTPPPLSAPQDMAKRHTLDRKAVATVECALCGLRQPVAAACAGCSVQFGRYACLKCNFFGAGRGAPGADGRAGGQAAEPHALLRQRVPFGERPALRGPSPPCLPAAPQPQPSATPRASLCHEHTHRPRCSARAAQRTRRRRSSSTATSAASAASAAGRTSSTARECIRVQVAFPLTCWRGGGRWTVKEGGVLRARRPAGGPAPGAGAACAAGWWRSRGRAPVKGN